MESSGKNIYTRSNSILGLSSNRHTKRLSDRTTLTTPAARISQDLLQWKSRNQYLEKDWQNWNYIH